MSIRVRFAPSPTGMPHVGVIRTAIFNWLLARHHNGQFILRIEDTDRSRYVEGAIENIIGSIKWLGMDLDEGPGIGGEHGPYMQSERLDLYHRYANYLVEEKKAYWCDCSTERLQKLREEQQKLKKDPGYDNHCRELELKGKPGDGKHVLRFATPLDGKTTFHDELRGDITVDNRSLDDLVLIKRDGFPTYHFASVVDDHHMAISHVFRGEEWISSAPKHQLLYNSLGIDPPKFVHVPVILGTDKKKLSKRHGATNVLEYKELGYLPEALFNFLALIGWNPGDDKEIMPYDELIEKFSLEKINISAGVFDTEKLDWMNGEYIRNMPLDNLMNRLKPFMIEWGWIDQEFNPWGEDYVKNVVSLIQERIKTLIQVRESAFYFFEDPKDFAKKDVKRSFRGEDIFDRMEVVTAAMEKIEWNEKELEDAIRSTAKEMEISAGKIIHPIRLAVSGLTYGPGVFELLLSIGKQRTIHRMKFAMEWLKKPDK